MNIDKPISKQAKYQARERQKAKDNASTLSMIRSALPVPKNSSLIRDGIRLPGDVVETDARKGDTPESLLLRHLSRIANPL